jgi:hypothetical protein
MSPHTKNTSSGAQVASETKFCSQCGGSAPVGDLFCRNCGTALAETAAPPWVPDPGANGGGDRTPPDQAVPAPSARGRKLIVGAGLAALAVAVAVGVLLAGGVVSLGGDSGPNPAQKRTVQTAMVDRDEFFKAERAYLGAYGLALTELRRYLREESEFKAENKRIEEEFADEFDACYRYYDIDCPEPDYPDQPKAPNFSPETKDIRAAAQDFEQLRVSLSSASPRGNAGRLRAQLIASVEAVKSEADHNADVLDEAVEPADGEAPGGIDKGKIKTLRKESALPAIQEMNRTAVRALRAVGLSLTRFDVPGGRDLDANDHSNEA